MPSRCPGGPKCGTRDGYRRAVLAGRSASACARCRKAHYATRGCASALPSTDECDLPPLPEEQRRRLVELVADAAVSFARCEVELMRMTPDPDRRVIRLHVDRHRSIAIRAEFA